MTNDELLKRAEQCPVESKTYVLKDEYQIGSDVDRLARCIDQLREWALLDGSTLSVHVCAALWEQWRQAGWRVVTMDGVCWLEQGIAGAPVRVFTGDGTNVTGSHRNLLFTVCWRSPVEEEYRLKNSDGERETMLEEYQP